MLSHDGMDGFDPYEDDAAGLFGSIAKAVGGAAKGVAKAATTVAKGTVTVAKTGAKVVNTGAKTVSGAVKTGQNLVGKVPVIGKGLKAVTTLAMSPYDISLGILSGQRIDNAVVGHFKNQLQAIKDVAPYAATVVSFVPGVGPGVSGAIAAAVALSEGKPITEALIVAAKNSLPGGPLAAAAFDVALAAAQRKSLSEITLAAVPLPPAQKDLLRQSLQVAADIAAGKRVDKIVIDRVNANLAKLPSGVAQAAQVGIALGQGQNIQKTLVKTGTNMFGKNALAVASNINKVAAGVSKSGIAKAVGAAQAVRNGSPAIGNALRSTAAQLTNPSQRLGFQTAVRILSQTQGNKQALAIARRNLPNAEAQQAFDAAIGTIAQTVAKNPGALGQRAGSIFTPNLVTAKPTLSPYQPNLKAAIDTLIKDPTLATQNPMVLAQKFGTSQQTVLDALRKVGSQRLLPWRSLSPNAARYIQRYSSLSPIKALTHGTSDTAGLDETGTKYIVAKGDSPFSIAKQLTGNGNRWVEMKPLNTDKKPSIDKNIWVGEVLNIPASWQKPTAKPAPSPGAATSTQPSNQVPSPVKAPTVTTSVVPGILQAKSILAAWGKTDGVNEAGVTDYGSSAADLSTDFGARDKLQLRSFQNWSNKPNNPVPDLVVDGILGPKSLASLQFWAENKASSVVPSVPGVVTTIPETVIVETPPAPSVPTTPVVISPGLPPVNVPVVTAPPVVTPPAVIAVPTPSNPAPPVPAVAPPSQPATPASVAGNAAGQSSKLGPALAGAAVGGTLFGLPGAIIGGVAGAAMS